MSATWQVVVESTSELLVEVDADTETDARRMALDAARDSRSDSWENQGIETTGAWLKAEHDAYADGRDLLYAEVTP
jgi:hypothetical protein